MKEELLKLYNEYLEAIIEYNYSEKCVDCESDDEEPIIKPTFIGFMYYLKTGKIQ